MDRESMAKLKLDKRLARRRGWIAQEDLQQALEDLPDAADKVRRLGDEAPAEATEPVPPAGAAE